MSDVQNEMDELLDDVEVDETPVEDEQDIDPENPDGEGETPTEQEEPKAEESEEDGDIVITIDGVETEVEEDDQPGDREWLKNLRKEHKAQKKRIRELEQKLQTPASAPQEEALGPEPTLENPTGNPDDAYDEVAFKRAYSEYFAKKQRIEKRKEEVIAKQEAEKRDWETRLSEYGRMKQELRVPDYEDAEETAREHLDVTQQGIIVKGAKNPAMLIYALGKNLKLMQDISSIKDPVKFAFAVAQLETKVKATPTKRTPPPPERRISGAGKPSVVTKQSLADLKEECFKKGDMTPYYRAKEKLRT